MAERRLAITIKGAISLGAYEAGAIAETLRLIAYNNLQQGATQWYVDAACGASAGSITSAMVAAALVRNDTEVLHRTWVTSVSLANLAPDDAKMSDDTILDALSLDRLARQNLTCPTIANPHPALRPAPSQLQLRFTLSRYAPEVISQDTLNDTKLSFHDFKDSADFTVGIRQSAGSSAIAVNIATSGVAPAGYHNADAALTGADAWSALVQTAIASGSFPFAFAPRDLRRWINDSWMDRYFQDGGTFDNDPIGQTINIAHHIDWGTEAFDDADRRFLMIHVEPFDATPPETIPGAQVTLDVNPLTLAGKFFPAILEQSENSGLAGIVTIDAQIAERAGFLNGLIDLVSGREATALPDPLMRALAAFRFKQIDGDKPDTPPIAPDILNRRISFFLDHMISDLARSEPAIFARVNKILQRPEEQTIFKNLALAYDLATNLVDKTKLTPILICPAERLAGSGLYAFGGFLVSQLRERDYAQGVYDAYQSWQAVAAIEEEEFLLDPVAPAAPPSAAQMFDACQDQYKQGVERLIERVDRVMHAVSQAATAPGFLGGVEAKALRIVLDAIANHYVGKAGSDL
jgi:predicted acylesterase/phospholipase RssA